MILHTDNSKDATKKQTKKKNKKTKLGLINEFSKAAGYRINIQKSAPFPNTNNELSEKSRKHPIYNHIRKINYLGKNLPKFLLRKLSRHL